MCSQRAVGRRGFLVRLSAVGAAGVAGTLNGLPGASAVDDSRRRATNLEEVTVEDFSRMVGAEFRVEREPGRSVPLELREAYTVGSPQTAGRRQPFSVIFRTPAGVCFQQDTYAVRNTELGTMRILLVPVDLPRKYSHLQAIFA